MEWYDLSLWLFYQRYRTQLLSQHKPFCLANCGRGPNIFGLNRYVYAACAAVGYEGLAILQLSEVQCALSRRHWAKDRCV